MGEITLVAAYVIPIIILAWIWLGIRGKIIVKLIITACLPLIYVLHWQGLQDHRGWPAEQKLPEQFILIAADVIEPVKGREKQAAIYLWIKPSEAQQPRAYRLDYSRELHQTLFEIRKRIKQGKRQMGLLREGKRVGDEGVPVGHGQRLEFIDAPRNTLPPKN
jgi:hypothetical protein